MVLRIIKITRLTILDIMNFLNLFCVLAQISNIELVIYAFGLIQMRGVHLLVKGVMSFFSDVCHCTEI